MGKDIYTITVAPATQPVTTNDAMDFCRIDKGSPDESLIVALVKAATLLCESYTNRVFVSRTYLGEFDCLDVSRFEKYPFAELRRGPLVSVTSVTLEEDGSPVVVSGVLTKDTASYARLLFSETLNTSDDVAYPLQVTFVAGYGTADDVPDDLKLAIKQAVLFWYENRGDVGPDDKNDGDYILPSVSRVILNAYRIANTFGG